MSFFSLKVINKAEKDECLVIRLVEEKGEYSKAVLNFDIPVKQLVKTNLIEWVEESTANVNGDQFSVELKPYEIMTYKFSAEKKIEWIGSTNFQATKGG